MLEVGIPLYPLQVQLTENKVGVVVRRLLGEGIFGNKLWRIVYRSCLDRGFLILWGDRGPSLSVIFNIHLIYLLSQRHPELLAVTGICGIKL